MRENAPRSFTEKYQASLSALKDLLANPNPDLEKASEVFLTEHEEELLQTLDWLINPDYVAGAGIFQSGKMKDAAREKAITARIKTVLEEEGCTVHLMSVDDFMENQPIVTIVSKIKALCEDSSVGVRDETGRPRAIVITGFSQSKFLTESGLQWLMETSEANKMMDVKKRIDLGLSTSQQNLSEYLKSVDDQTQRERIAAYVFAHIFFCNWQALAIRKNSRKENIYYHDRNAKRSIRSFPGI